MSEDLHKGAFTGCYDLKGLPIHEGQFVKIYNNTKYTKVEYHLPVYRVVFDPPSFTLKWIGGGRDIGNYHFQLRNGGEINL